MQKRVSLAVGEGLAPSRQSSETLERKSWANSQIATNSPNFFLPFVLYRRATTRVAPTGSGGVSRLPPCFAACVAAFRCLDRGRVP